MREEEEEGEEGEEVEVHRDAQRVVAPGLVGLAYTARHCVMPFL